MTRPGPRNHIIQAIVIGSVLTGLSYWLGLQFHWIGSVKSFTDWLEVFAVWTQYVCTWLCVVERRINYPIGAISSVAYAWLFIKTGLVASVILNIYLVPQLIYGWFRWNRDVVTRPVTHVKLKFIPAYVIVSGLFYLGAVVLNHWVGGTMAWVDGLVLALSILAQFMLDNKLLENWIVWIAVDIIAVYDYFATGLPIVGIQYVLFLLNAFYGYYAWRKSQNAKIRQEETDPVSSGVPRLAVS